MSSTTPSRVAIYACISAASRAPDIHSLLPQLRLWCIENRHVVVGQYVDDDSDGSNRRPERVRLMREATGKHFDMVLVWSLNCFDVKGVGETAVDIQRLIRHGVAFHSFTEDHLCTDNAAAPRALLPVIHSFAKLERQKASKRIKAGLQRARAEGKQIGRPRFSDTQRAKLKGALDAGKNWLRVSRGTGIPYSTVKKHARAMGYEPPGYP